MSIVDIYIFNIASEMVMSVVLVFLFATCFLQYKRFRAIRPLQLLIGVNLLLLLCQIAEWYLMLISRGQIGTVPMYHGWKVVTYTLDYLLGLASSLCFYNYTCVRISDLYQQRGKDPKGLGKKSIRYLSLWSIFSVICFGICMSQNWFFFLREDGTEIFHYEIYVVLYLMALVVTVATVVQLYLHRKVLGKWNFRWLLFYKITPMLLLIPDLLHGTCLTYLMRAFYSLILYIYIDSHVAQELAERKAQLAQQEKELLEQRTQIMLSQMQPHFLYNTLTTISALCYLENAKKAQQVVDKFAAYFRQNLDALGKEAVVPFEKELEHTQTYLWIEKVRFEEKLNVEFCIGPKDFFIPSLTLQPLVENAVKHGIRKKEDGGTVRIETKETEEEYLVIIQDDGAGFFPGENPEDGRSHVGIENVSSRLQLLSAGCLELNSIPGQGTVATVHLPKENKA